MRQALRHRAGLGPPPNLPPGGALARPGGAFVSLRLRGEPRGAVGTCATQGSLAATAVAMASWAAGDDPRFPPLSPEETLRAEARIVAVGPPRRVAGPGDLDPARDGIRVSRGWRRGLVLPEAARRGGWEADAGEALRRACLQAGLPPQAWREPDCLVEAFAAEEIVAPDPGDPAPGA